MQYTYMVFRSLVVHYGKRSECGILQILHMQAFKVSTWLHRGAVVAAAVASLGAAAVLELVRCP